MQRNACQCALGDDESTSGKKIGESTLGGQCHTKITHLRDASQSILCKMVWRGLSILPPPVADAGSLHSRRSQDFTTFTSISHKRARLLFLFFEQVNKRAFFHHLSVYVCLCFCPLCGRVTTHDIYDPSMCYISCDLLWLRCGII